MLSFYLVLTLTENENQKDDKKSLGDLQVAMKCQVEPSAAVVKLEFGDWPLLFKVCIFYFFFFFNEILLS